MHRTPLLLLVSLLAAGCADGVPPTATEPLASVTSTAGTPHAPPVVVVQPMVSGAAGAAVTDDLAEAITTVASGGTILVHPGHYTGPLPPLDRPVTLRGVGSELPVVDAGADCWALHVSGPDGPVALRGLRILSNPCGGGVAVEGAHGAVEIEGSVFDGSGTGVVVMGGSSSAPVEVRDNDFVGHRAQVRTNEAPADVRVLGNRFSGPETGINFGPGTSGRIEDNVLTGCGGEPACISVGSLFDDLTGGGAVDIVGNTLEVEISEQLPSGLLVGTGDHRIVGNTVRGVGSDPGAATPERARPLTLAGIEVVDGARTEVSGNSVENAFIGLQFGLPVTASGLDNVVTDVDVAIQAFPGGEVSIRSSDLTDWAVALQAGGATQDFTCNWWGDAAGPGGPDPEGLFTPWATSPVAGTSTTTCSGTP